MFIYLLILYASLGFSFTLCTIALQYMTPWYLVGIRMLVAGIFLLGYDFFYNRRKKITLSFNVSFPLIGLFSALIVFHIVLSYVPEFIALQYMSGAKACLLFNLSPFLTAALTFIVYNQRLTLRQINGLLVGFLGFIPLLFSVQPQEGSSFLSPRISWPEILMLISVTSSVIGWLLVQRLVLHYHYKPIRINGIAMLYGGLFVTLIAVLLGGPVLQPLALQHLGLSDTIRYAILSIGSLIVVANFLSYNLYAWLLKHTSATWLSFCGFLAPLFAALTDWLILGTVISYGFIITLLAVIVGLYLFYIDQRNAPL